MPPQIKNTEMKHRRAGPVAPKGGADEVLPPPPFSLADLKAAIPKHCFERSLPRSLAYLARDFALIAGCLAAALAVEHSGLVPGFVLWPAYWFVQGCFMTGLWVTAHECGHQSFSPYKWVNDTIGTIGHTMLLVPYHPWRISHSHHHGATGDADNDEVFAPATRSDFQESDLSPSAPRRLFGIVRMLLVGWPAYLIANASGPKKYVGKTNDHFNPSSALFTANQRSDVIRSDIALVVWFGVLAYLAHSFGTLTVLNLYGVPLLWTNHWLVLITYLQHTDIKLPHFRGTEWNWLRGALCTIDRSYGPVLDNIFHHIADTHVCHHIFSKIPHYHAQEATMHLKKALGEYYFRDDTHFYAAVWESYAKCLFVEDEGEVLHFKSS